MNKQLIKPFHSSTNPEYLVTIRSVFSEIISLDNPPSKINEKVK